MRKIAGVLFAVAMLMPLGIAASPGGAAASGTTCKPATGKITVSPGLSSTAAVQTFTISGPITGCVGGGVISGTLKGTLKTPAITTADLAKQKAPLKFTSTIVWNTKKTSTLTLSAANKTGYPIHSTVTGKVKTGPFVGLTFKSLQTVTFGPTVGGKITLLNIKGNGSITLR